MSLYHDVKEPPDAMKTSGHGPTLGQTHWKQDITSDGGGQAFDDRKDGNCIVERAAKGNPIQVARRFGYGAIWRSKP
jgi:hypothetical protein